MTIIAQCPRCEKEFEANEDVDGMCPACRLGYEWEDQFNDGYDECWSVQCWDDWMVN